MTTNKTKGKAILFMILSSFFFTTMNMFGKLSTLTPYQKTFITNIVATIIVCIIIKKRKASFLGNKSNRIYLFIRGLMGTLSICAFYFSLKYMYLSDATMLNMLSPFFTIIFSFIILKENLSKKDLVFLLIAFIGSIFVIRPHFNSSLIPSLMGLLAAATAGIAYTMIRVIGDKEDFFTIILSFSGIASIFCFPFMFIDNSNLNIKNIIIMFLAGLSFILGQIFLTLAYKNAPASEISMFTYIGLFIAAIYGLFIFNEIPDIYSILGYLIILFSSILNTLNKKNKS